MSHLGLEGKEHSVASLIHVHPDLISELQASSLPCSLP